MGTVIAVIVRVAAADRAAAPVGRAAGGRPAVAWAAEADRCAGCGGRWARHPVTARDSGIMVESVPPPRRTAGSLRAITDRSEGSNALTPFARRPAQDECLLCTPTR